MVSQHPFQLKVISDTLGVEYGKFYGWYKENLSSFRAEIPVKIEDKKSFNESEIYIPIHRAEHLGYHMAIDEKHIDGRFYTVLSNGKTSKVALLISSIDPKQIGDFLLQFGSEMDKVRVLSRDLAPSFEYVGNTYFPKAKQVADKYHVIKHAVDSLQDIRIRLKQAKLSLQKSQKESIRQAKGLQDKNKEKPKSRIKKNIALKIENGETLVELLTRSRYLLNILPDKWNKYQKARSVLLFQYYPELKVAYEIINEFRKWYNPTEEMKDTFLKENELINWQFKAESIKIKEIQNFKKLVSMNEEYILNYHDGFETNAVAESVNAKIQNAIRQNRGTRDIDFFHYRLAQIL